jgi:magnesium chelatase family protein
MLASRLPGILPALSHAEMLEAAVIFSASKQTGKPVLYRRPFRNPHHTASAVALVGGGSVPRPGEISLAHRGVLFLDELPEFQRQVLEVLRAPLESGEIMIARASGQVRYPAYFQLVAAMNPCPCGYFGDSERACRCSPDHIRRYRNKISGPLLDRIDLQLAVNRLPIAAIRQASADIESSATVRERVLQARRVQLERQQKTNANLTIKELEHRCSLRSPSQRLLEAAVNRLKLSPRAYHRILRVARTIADMSQHCAIEDRHLLEAISYRALDREAL